MQKRNPKFSIIGAGKVGSTLALALHDKKIPIVSVISKSGKHAIDLAKKVHCKRASTKLADIDPSTEYILIAVSDSALEEVASELSKVKQLKFKKLCVVHCSGVYSSDILASLKKKGATVASMHPIQTFPKTRTPEQLRNKLKNIFYGIEGNSQAIEKVEIIVKLLEGKAVIISEDMKPLYHVACVFASSYYGDASQHDQRIIIGIEFESNVDGSFRSVIDCNDGKCRAGFSGNRNHRSDCPRRLSDNRSSFRGAITVRTAISADVHDCRN